MLTRFSLFFFLKSSDALNSFIHMTTIIATWTKTNKSYYPLKIPWHQLHACSQTFKNFVDPHLTDLLCDKFQLITLQKSYDLYSALDLTIYSTTGFWCINLLVNPLVKPHDRSENQRSYKGTERYACAKIFQSEFYVEGEGVVLIHRNASNY